MSEQTEILPMERVSEGECKNYVKYDQMAEKDEKEQKKKKQWSSQHTCLPTHHAKECHLHTTSKEIREQRRYVWGSGSYLCLWFFICTRLNMLIFCVNWVYWD